MDQAKIQYDTIEGNVVVVRLSGEFGMESASGLDKTLQKVLEERYNRIVVDLGGVTHLASRAISYLVACAEAIRTRGGRFAVTNAPKKIADMLVIMGLADALQLIKEEAKAVRFVSEG